RTANLVAMRRGAVVVSAALVAVTAAGCGSGGTAKPQTLLAQAKQKIDSTQALHFVITSTNVAGNGTDVTGGVGDIARPASIKGTFQISLSGFHVSVKIIAANGKFYAEAPFQTSYQLTDPDKYGIGNPASLIDRTQGLSSLLANIENPTSEGQTRISGELLDKVTGAVPGTKIPSALPDSVPSKPVQVSALINAKTHEVRQFILTGPLTSPTNSTFTVTLTQYGEPVHIDLPQ
ncbi:MAG TPA: LppX_LprAFG lipoprotein, partial [Mycobacteriales bacterium]